MLNKKAEEANSITTILIFGIIAIIVAILVISGIADPIVNRLPNILPDFNNSQTPSKIPVMLRYNLIHEDVEYYDGLNWNSFPDWESEIKFEDDIKINKGDARFYFEDYFYARRTLPINIETNPYEEITIESFSKEKQGDVLIIHPGQTQEEKFLRYYILTLRDQLLLAEEFKSGSTDLLEDSEKAVLPISIKTYDYKREAFNLPITQELEERMTKTIGSTTWQHAKNVHGKNPYEVAGYSMERIDKKEDSNSRTTTEVTTYSLTSGGSPTGIFFEETRSGLTKPLRPVLSTNEISAYARKLPTSGSPIQGTYENEIKETVLNWRDSRLGEKMPLRTNSNTKTIYGNVDKVQWEDSVFLVFERE